MALAYLAPSGPQDPREIVGDARSGTAFVRDAPSIQARPALGGSGDGLVRWGWFLKESESGGGVGGFGERLDPGPVDLRLTASEEFEDEVASGVYPDPGAASTVAGAFWPGEHEWFAASEFGGDDDLQVRECAVLDIGFGAVFVGESSHRVVLPRHAGNGERMAAPGVDETIMTQRPDARRSPANHCRGERHLSWEWRP